MITPVIRYVESHFEKVQSNASPDSEVLNMLGGDGGSQVDVVFYLIQNSNGQSGNFQVASLTRDRTKTGGHQVSTTVSTTDERHTTVGPVRHYDTGSHYTKQDSYTE